VSTEPLDVAAAVLERADGSFLLAKRPPGKVYAGYWEFPGGKIEPGETPAHALARELHEELGIEVHRAFPWITRLYTYPHATVRLHFMRVSDWYGIPRPHEGQELSWQTPGHPTVAPMLPANGPILKSLELPAIYGITCAGVTGVPVFLARLEAALGRGLRMVQVREKQMQGAEFRRFLTEVVERVHQAGGKVLLNSEHVEHSAQIDGVHLTARALFEAGPRPTVRWLAASCHDASELQRAREIGVDFAVLGPVAATPSHPNAKPLGWEEFARLSRDTTLPLYALGGMQPADLPLARASGAHGLAMLRGAWSG
jgi:8-oxo-dGTP diphosphatase